MSFLLGIPALLALSLMLFLLMTRRNYTFRQRSSFAKNLPKKALSIGVFHPYANGGGGGERVLYGAMLALVEQLKQAPSAYSLQLILYTGNDGLTADQLIDKAAAQFNLPKLVELQVAKYIHLVELPSRDLLDPSRYPRFTLLWQAIAQFRLALDAFKASRKHGVYPQFWMDTLGCPFSYLVASIGFGCTVIAYTHYPMISTDMIKRVKNRELGLCNDATISSSSTRSLLKYIYYRLFAAVYGLVGRFCTDVAMVNSTWTRNHIKALWGVAPSIVYPGCGSIEDNLEFDLENRKPLAISLAQFRPEKNHLLQLQSLHALYKAHGEEMIPRFPDFRLVMAGSCPTKASKELVESLKLEASKLGIRDHIQFLVSPSFQELKPYLRCSSIGIHTMTNEHFGISNVEIMAAGIIHIAHNSAGPRLDIVKPGTGFLATTAEEYAHKIWLVLNDDPVHVLRMREAARESTRRFSDAEFNSNFLSALASVLPEKLRGFMNN